MGKAKQEQGMKLRNWRGIVISKIRARSRRSDKRYRTWRKAVIERDMECQICGSVKALNAHHLNNWKDHPKDRYNVDNGKVLCRGCHKAFHNLYKNGYADKCTKGDYLVFEGIAKYFIGKVTKEWSKERARDDVLVFEEPKFNFCVEPRNSAIEPIFDGDGI